ncbi:excinuclease ABC subunit UvrC, partial [Candidatus Saccharibacteria bacterium]|nr:excinuclease ABC subunit UvrC [Candidatus Saccharibacteria bacterium]
NLPKIPTRIEGFDISHISGSDVVASMVVFTNGVSDRSEYRKFKTRINKNDDFFNMNETIGRRLSKKNLKSWGVPELILIDGGKGQLDAAIQARDLLGQNELPFIGLAKRDEQIVIKGENFNKQKLTELDGWCESTSGYTLLNLPKSSHVIRLLQRIRDESHRFAVSYHTSISRNRQTKSQLDEIPGIGPRTRSKLIRRFGSVAGIKKADVKDVELVIGVARAKVVLSRL